jgi:hypothetical protein
LGQAVATTIAGFFVVASLCGSTCVVGICVEHGCDPCLQNCKCSVCPHQHQSSSESHKLTRYRFSVFDDPQGGVVRRMSEIVGLSLDFADGPRPHTPADFERFAEGVIEFNGLVLQSRERTWEPGMVQVFDESVVVPFAPTSGEASLTFLFDRGGNLLEIDEVRR